MKKLMVMAAIVCAAISSQAASIAWTTSTRAYCDSTGTPATSFTGGQVVLVVMDGADAWASATEITASTVVINQTASKAGRLSGSVTFNYTAGSDSNLIDNGDYLGLMWKDGTTGELSQLVYVADGSAVTGTYQVSGLANNSTGLTGKTIALSGNFMAESIPEPTSAMLLMLGLAGLALKRKQA